MQPDYKVALVTGISFMLLRYGSLDLARLSTIEKQILEKLFQMGDGRVAHPKLLKS